MHSLLLAYISAPSAPAEPMECESVAELELSREIEDVIESPVREDMAAAAAARDKDRREAGSKVETILMFL